MPSFRPGYQHQKTGSESLPNIHEEPTQLIQGGIAGQHYHMSAAAYRALIAMFTSGYISLEPVMTLYGEPMLSKTGDVMTGPKILGITSIPDVAP
jgi:hypothetical protein